MMGAVMKFWKYFLLIYTDKPMSLEVIHNSNVANQEAGNQLFTIIRKV